MTQTHRRSIKAKLLIPAIVGGCALLATATLAQVAINQLQPGGVTIKGKVADLFDDKFVLEDSSGRILVQTGPGGPRTLSVTAGETLTVVGLPRGRTFDAREIKRENGETLFSAPAEPQGPVAMTSPAPAGPDSRLPEQPTATGLLGMRGGVDRENVLRLLKEVGVTALGEPVRHPKHIEIPGRASSGKMVIVSLDRFGRLDEIEDADHDKERYGDRRPIGAAEAERIARDAGYTVRDPIERKKHHFEIVASSRKGEMMELHMDFGGNIYKQIWIR